MTKPTTLLLCTFAGALLLAACGSTPDRRTLYLPAPERAGEVPAPMVRVALPRHVEHRSLRVRDTDQRLRTLPDESWAESPAEGFERLLAEQLAARATLPVASRVEVRLSRFEREADGVFRAIGHWRLRDGGTTLRSGGIDFERRVDTVDGAALVEAMSAAVAAAADTIIAATATE